MYDLTRRNLLRTGVAAAAAGAVTSVGWAETAPAYAGRRRRRPFVPYSRDSFFRSRIIGDPIDRARTRAFRSFMRSHPDQREYPFPRINGVDGNDWGTAFAMGRARDPIWRLTGDHHPMARRLERRGFHAPEWLGDMLTGTSDSPLCVVDRASGFTMFCADAEVVGPRLIRASAGAITYHRSNGLDHRNPRSNNSRNFTSRGRISDAMVIRKDLVRYGVANDTDLGHVLQMFLVETRTSDGYCSPMVDCETNNFGFGAQGERLAIAPWVNLDRRRLSPEARVIARTLQNYGCYIGDNSGSQSCLKAEQENGRRRVWRGRLDRDALSGISWDDFVVLR
jgi:hypothetical protein